MQVALRGLKWAYPPACILWDRRTMDEQQWNEYKKKSQTWSIRISYQILHSQAYKEISYCPALKLLTWFYEKIKVLVNKGRRGKHRYQVIDGDISFTYLEAKLRGLSCQQTSKGLRELHRLGFIDIKQPGSALRGDWTRYSISDRWKHFGTDQFQNIEFPRSVRWVNFGFGGSKQRRKRLRKKDIS